jgi:hypothetical protein
MKYFFAILACLVIAAPAFADESGNATAHVFVQVNPNVSLAPLDPWVDLGTVQTGVFQGFIPWRVDANTQNVQFWAAASNLYKADDPTDPTVDPIPVYLSNGIQIHIPDGGPVGQEDEYLGYVGGTDIDGYPGYETEAIEYESSQSGHMSQDIDMYVWWDQTDSEKPMGEYSGMVRLSAMIVLF